MSEYYCDKCGAKVSEEDKFCLQCGQELGSEQGNNAVLWERVKYLENRIRILEDKVPNSAVIDKSFFKRAFAIYGHSLLAGFMIGLPIWLIIILLSFSLDV